MMLCFSYYSFFREYKMIVTIDGPCGSGKSTVARGLAERMGYEYLDTGAMYRAVTWKSMDKGVELETDVESIVKIANNISIDFQKRPDGVHVLCDGQDVTREIRTPDVTVRIKHVADEPSVRDAMVRLQREYAEREKSIVTEGRDQGSVVFPDANVKFYLDADVETRARRRLLDYKNNSFDGSFDEVISAIKQRDKADKERRVGGLRKTDSMIVLDSSDRGPEEVIDKMEQIINSQR